MKNFIYLLFLFIFFSSSAQELRFHLLDSSLNEVVLRNPNKISKTEKLKIHNYVEYYIDTDSKITNISYYYAQGKIPTYDNWSTATTIKKYGSISFSKPQNREGILRSRGSIIPVKFVEGQRFRNSDYILQNFKKYWPNGQLMHHVRYDNEKSLLDGEYLHFFLNHKMD